MQSSHDEVQSAIYALLSPNSTVESGLATIGVLGVYDMRAVPQNQDFPYVTLGDGYEIPNNALTPRGYTLYETIHIWSRQRGTSEASTILARINSLLDQKPLALNSLKHISTMYNRAVWLNDPDGLTLHVALQYQIFTQEQ